MKRKVASRRLKLTCNECDCTIMKGDVYYRERVVVVDYEDVENRVYGYTFNHCARCVYKKKRHEERFKKFVDSGTCTHPITDMNYRVMFGEYYAQEPDYEECRICKKKF